MHALCASGGLCGLAGVVAMVRPRMCGFVVTYVLINIVALDVSTPLLPPGVSVAAHVGGFVTGFFVARTLFARALAAARCASPRAARVTA